MDEIVLELYFYEYECVFRDCEGYVVDDLFAYITPSMLYLFKRNQTTMMFEPRIGFFVELIRPEEDY